MEITITMRAGLKREVAKEKWCPTNTNITNMSKKCSQILLFFAITFVTCTSTS